MSGCCGQGPVIVSGAAATPRVDVETVLLCDVLPDGTVAGVALVEPIYDTNTGDRVGTRTVNPVTGAAYTPVGTLQPCQPDGCNATTSALVLCDEAPDGTLTHFVRATTYDCEGALLGTLDRTLDGADYTVTGTVGACPSSPDCESPTTPTATVGLCLADGTPIAVTVVRDCDGVVTSEGWINLTTGAFSAGAPPAGTVACGDSQSVQVSGTFCDVDGTGEVVGLVLIEYSYAADGTIDSVRLVDATTGGTYTPTGTITTCPVGVEQPEQDLVQLCDVAVDGTSTAFIRDYRRDELGAITGHSDYLLDGTAYVPTGTVGVCHAECRNSSTVLVCDVPADSSSEITPTMVDSNVAAVGQTQFQNHPGPYTALWSGGTFAYPAGPGPAQQHLSAVGQITADMSACDGASGTLTISVRVRNNGPDTGQAWDGALRLFRGTTAIATHNALEWAPVGWQGTLTVSAPVTAADIAAGDIRVALILETYHLGAKSWTADQFDASLVLEGCEATSSTQFLRTLVTDCVTGDVVSTTDTTLDGAPYTVTGEVGQCSPTEAPAECRNCEAVVLCDTVDGADPVSFLRTVCRDCTGAVISVLDTDLGGTAPYAVTGTVGACAEPCVTESSLVLCDSTPVDLGPLLTFTDTDPTPLFQPNPPDGNVKRVNLAPGQPFWDGGAVTFAPPVGGEGTGNSGTHRYIAASIGAAAVECPPCGPAGDVTITVTGRACNQGPVLGVLTCGRWRIVDASTTPATTLANLTLSNVGASGNFPSCRDLTATATVSYDKLLSGDLAVSLDLETHDENGGEKTWIADQFAVTATLAPAAGCGTQFLRTIRTACSTGTVLSVTDTDLDGAPYTVSGDVAQCVPPTTSCGSSECRDCETLVLCDVPTAAPVTITGTAASGTLSNGVGWTSTGATNTTAMAANLSNADGSWWGLHSFPHAVTAPTKWTFSRPSIVEFSVYVRYFATDPTISHAQLPPGLEVVSLPDGYSYNETTGVLTRTSDAAPTDPCSYVTDPRIASSARFRTASAVTSFTTAPAPNSRVAACGVFFTYWAGAVSVLPGGPFLRQICRSCDGTATVTDTLLDGITPYTVAGIAGVCEPPAPPEPESCCQPVQVCIQQDPTQEVEFISNEGHLNDNSVDPVWKWTTDLTAANPPWYDMYEFQYSGAWSVVDSDTARPAWWVSPHPNGASAQSSPAQPNEGPSLLNAHWYPRAFFDLPDNADPATIQIQATVFNADQIGRAFRLNNGAWQSLPATATHNGTTYTFGPATIPGAQAGRNFLYLDVEETVGGGSGLMVHLKVTYEVIPETRSWTRMVCCDDSLYYLDEDGQRQDAVPDGWHVAPCAGAAGGSTTDCAKQVVERCGCDDTTGDGIGDVMYTELWAVDPCGGAAPVLLGTYLDGDPSQPYTPVAPVECTVEEDAAPSPLSTGVRAVTGTVAQNLAGSFPGLQSVSLTVLAGAVNVTMTDGSAVPIPAGTTMTWSVAKDEDSALAAASFAGASAAASYLLNYTFR
ncbi:hypothetical protein ABZ312_09530 [Streptomyces sp. NPDC006207]